MKKGLLTVVACSIMAFTQAQTISNFENLLTSSGNTLNGSEAQLGTAYTSGNAIFQNYYDTAFGGYWRDGFAISSVVDSTTGDFTNLYGVITGTGFEQSTTWAVGQNGAVVNLMSGARNEAVSGVYVTNTTYAHDVIRDGSQFSKPFGGDTGDDPDFFALSAKGYVNGSLTTDSALVYLADYRFEDNSLDYIENQWVWLDLSSLGAVDSLVFNLHTTDVGEFGPNTPFFFALDNFTMASDPVGIFTYNKVQLSVFPNPTTEVIHVSEGAIDAIFNSNGQMVKRLAPRTQAAFVGDLPPGVYFVAQGQQRIRFVKR